MEAGEVFLHSCTVDMTSVCVVQLAQVHIGEMQAANGKIPCFCGCGTFNTNL